MRTFSCDFETVNSDTDCRVWEWGVYEVTLKAERFVYGTHIDDFFQFIFNVGSCTLYFHNLAFDGQFILYWLFRNGYKWVESKEVVYDKTFTTLISDMNQFYAIDIYFLSCKKMKKIRILDSLKILRLPVSALPAAFGLEYEKGEIDYNKERQKGYQPTDAELDYLKRDCKIVALSLHQMFSNGLTKMTIGADALYLYRNSIGEKKFQKWFPTPVYDWFIRQSYRGGFVYVNPSSKGKLLGEGCVLDVNSLYPSRMYYCNLPYGEGVHYKGKYVYDNEYPLYVQTIVCNFELKKGKIPCIQLKNNPSFVATEYAITSKGEDVGLCLTSVDMELFFEQYNVYNIEYIEGFKFKCSNTMFKEFIGRWNEVKETAAHEGNKGMRTIAKAINNNLYGKFATNPLGKSKQPIYSKTEDFLSYKLLPEEQRQAVYIPVGTFVTAYARFYTITSSQMIKDYSIEKYGVDMYYYSDTDSIHTSLPLNDLKELLDLDDFRLGAWKVESHFTRAKFLRAKCYIEEIDGEVQVTCAGMPSRCHSEVTFENFNFGSEYSGKLTAKNVKGGKMLSETTYKLKK